MPSADRCFKRSNRSPSTQGVSGTQVAGRNAKTPESEDCRAGQEMCNLLRRIHSSNRVVPCTDLRCIADMSMFLRLQRHRARSQRSQGNGRSVERRSPRQCPGGALVVQRGKGIDQSRRLTADHPSCVSRRSLRASPETVPVQTVQTRISATNAMVPGTPQPVQPFGGWNRRDTADVIRCRSVLVFSGPALPLSAELLR